MHFLSSAAGAIEGDILYLCFSIFPTELTQGSPEKAGRALDGFYLQHTVAESICDVLSSDKEKHDYACAFRMNKGNVKSVHSG